MSLGITIHPTKDSKSQSAILTLVTSQLHLARVFPDSSGWTGSNLEASILLGALPDSPPGEGCP
jgi:hypothetical protein